MDPTFTADRVKVKVFLSVMRLCFIKTENFFFITHLIAKIPFNFCRGRERILHRYAQGNCGNIRVIFIFNVREVHSTETEFIKYK